MARLTNALVTSDDVNAMIADGTVTAKPPYYIGAFSGPYCWNKGDAEYWLNIVDQAPYNGYPTLRCPVYQDFQSPTAPRVTINLTLSGGAFAYIYGQYYYSSQTIYIQDTVDLVIEIHTQSNQAETIIQSDYGQESHIIGTNSTYYYGVYWSVGQTYTVSATTYTPAPQANVYLSVESGASITFNGSNYGYSTTLYPSPGTYYVVVYAGQYGGNYSIAHAGGTATGYISAYGNYGANFTFNNGGNYTISMTNPPPAPQNTTVNFTFPVMPNGLWHPFDILINGTWYWTNGQSITLPAGSYTIQWKNNSYYSDQGYAEISQGGSIISSWNFITPNNFVQGTFSLSAGLTYNLRMTYANT